MSIGLELDEAFQNTSPFADGGISSSPFPNFGKNVSVVPESTYTPQNEIEDELVLEEDPRTETIHPTHLSSLSPVTMIPPPTTEATPPSPVLRAQPVIPQQHKKYVPNVANIAREEQVRETFNKDDEPAPAVHKSKKSSNDFLKSILFSLMILLGISAHAFVAFLFENYVTSTGNYSIKQEVGMRLLYPVSILLIIYLVKNYR